MKRRRERIVMVTAYDYPSGRIADAAGIDVVLVGDSAAMTVLGNDSTVHATMDEMVMLTRAAARGAGRPLVVADMPFGSFQVSDEEAVRNGIRFVKEGRRRRGQARRSRPDALARARARRSGHPGNGPRGPDAAVRDDARRFPGAGPYRREGAAAPAGRTRARGRRLLHDRPRGGASRGRGEDHAGALGPDNRHRLRPRLRRPGARLPRPARPLRRQGAALREALRRPRRGDAGRAGALRGRCALGRVPGGRAHVLDPEDELAAFEQELSGSRAESGTET